MRSMPPAKGLPQRTPDPSRRATLVELDPDVRSVLDDLKKALRLPLAVVVEEFVRNTPRDPATGLPVWAMERIAAEQLPGMLDAAA
jgi:hypothetical protein